VIGALALSVTGVSSASTTCTNQTLTVLLSGYTCTWTTVDGVVETFGNFNLINNNNSAGGAVPTPNWSATFTELGGSTAFRLTLTPTPSITETSTAAGSGDVYQFQWFYDISNSAPGSAGLLNSETLGTTVGNIVVDGSVQAVKTVADRQGNGLGSPSLNFNIAGQSNTTGTSSRTFAGQTFIRVFDSVNVNSGSNTGSGSATLTSFYNQVGVTTTVPEPASVSLIGLGLLGFLARKFRK